MSTDDEQQRLFLPEAAKAEALRRSARLRMAGMGLEFSASVVGGLFLGYLLDDWLGSEPWLLLAGTFGGLASAVFRLVRLSRHLESLSRDVGRSQ